MQESDIFAKVLQSCFSDPFSLQSKQLQSDYVSSCHLANLGNVKSRLESAPNEFYLINSERRKL
jgi:hypothetical protein